eukprot:9481446-Pyramimonas_sp.AAC.1
MLILRPPSREAVERGPPACGRRSGISTRERRSPGLRRSSPRPGQASRRLLPGRGGAPLEARG